jgi:hypothetical protein
MYKKKKRSSNVNKEEIMGEKVMRVVVGRWNREHTFHHPFQTP